MEKEQYRSRPGSPKTATTEDNLTKIHGLILADRRLKIREIAETVGMSKDRVGISCMKFWAWKSCRRDGCRVCSLRTTNATVRPLQSSVWHCLSAIRRSFCVVSWPSTKHGSTGTHQRPRNRPNSGLQPANLLRRRRRLSHRPERWWPPFFGIHKVWSTSTTWRRAKRSQGCTMPNYWADSPLNSRKYDTIWWRKKCSSIMTTHRLTLPPSPRPNWNRIGLRIATPCTIFFRFVPVRLLFVSKLEKVSRWTEKWVAAKEAYFADIEKTNFQTG